MNNNNNFIFFNKKAISPVVATALLLVVAVVAVVGFQNWFNSYQSSMFTKTEQDSSSGNLNTMIDTIVGSDLYFKNGYNNLTISDIKIDGTSCFITPSTYSNGFTKIDIGNCTRNATSSIPEIVVLTDKGVFSKKIYMKYVPYVVPTLNCSILTSGEWILVPGNPILNTTDFCVMKYEAKDVGGVATSQPALSPWVNINHSTAITECSNLGTGYHLITNVEWTTIARNIESNSLNWDSGLVGTGSMFRGHSDAAPFTGLNVSNVDDYWDQTGQVTPSIQKRALILNNSEVIWDFGGNVWEWNSDICIQNSPWSSSMWIEWTNALLSGAGQEKDLAGPIGAYTSTNGVGKYWGSGNGNGFLRGGFYNSYGNAGVFALSMTDGPSVASPYNGFRCSYTQ